MAHTIGVGESIVIPQREITEEMHDRRVTLGLAPKNELKNGAKAKILRAYARPRDQEAVEIDVTPDGVKVTALAKGYALVDVIDEISEPAGHDTDIYVVREPQLEAAKPDLIALAREADDTKVNKMFDQVESDAAHKDETVTITAHAPVEIVKEDEPAPMEIKSAG